MTGDPRAFKQIALNLVSNAIKFTERGGTVTVSAGVEGSRLVLRVADTGVGIAAEDLKRIGDPFFQAGKTYQRRHEGTGLGLSIVKSLVGLHGGEMTVQSKIDEGTTVTVALPLTFTPQAAQHLKQYRDADAGVAIRHPRASPSGEEKCLEKFQRRRHAAPPPRRQGGRDRSGRRARPGDAHPAAQPERHGCGRAGFAAVSAIIANALFLQAGRHPAPMFGSVAVMPPARRLRNPLPRPRPVEADARLSRHRRQKPRRAQSCRSAGQSGQGDRPHALAMPSKRSRGRPRRSGCPPANDDRRHLTRARAAWRRYSAR